ncbi:MAG: flagellar hook-basal body complex protein [Planctomycetes bacterium]|jgi:flagellar basal-body rod protein FlgF|nr:flagellar hook-basal body complex protein [Planctomycetota bacterium]
MGNFNDVSASSLAALTREYRAIAQNLANVRTAGYKQHVSKFHRLLQQTPATPNDPVVSEAPAEVQNEVTLDFRQGGIMPTGRSLDVAIEGEGFFVINTARRGPLYTRNGQFMTNANRQLVTTRGELVAGAGGPLVIPDNVPLQKVAIGKDGTMSAGAQEIGQLQIVAFDRPNDLLPQGASTFAAPPQMRSTPGEHVTLHQGFVENSNVSAINELVKLIQVTRLYEAGVKSIGKQDERQRMLLRFATG